MHFYWMKRALFYLNRKAKISSQSWRIQNTQLYVTSLFSTSPADDNLRNCPRDWWALVWHRELRHLCLARVHCYHCKAETSSIHGQGQLQSDCYLRWWSSWDRERWRVSYFSCRMPSMWTGHRIMSDRNQCWCHITLSMKESWCYHSFHNWYSRWSDHYRARSPVVQTASNYPLTFRVAMVHYHLLPWYSILDRQVHGCDGIPAKLDRVFSCRGVFRSAKSTYQDNYDYRNCTPVYFYWWAAVLVLLVLDRFDRKTVNRFDWYRSRWWWNKWDC